MLDLSTEKRCREWLDASLRLRREITSSSADLIRQFVGQDYRSGFCDEDDNFENHAFEWCTTVVPHFCSSNPTIVVTDMEIEDKTTELYTRVLRSWTRQTNPITALRASALDCQFDFGMFIIDEQPTPGRKYESEFMPMRPVLRRLSPRQYFRDVATPMFGYPRGEGHILLKSREEMLRAMGPDGRPKYDAAKIQAATALGGLEEFKSDMLQDGWNFDEDDDDLLVVAEIFNKDTGSWVCFTPNDGGGGGMFLSDEREYTGPEDGCYVMVEIQPVPDQVYPLAALAVTKRVTAEVNKFRKAASEDAATAKKLTIVGAKSTEILANVRDAQSGSVLTAAGFNGQIANVDTGGVNPEIYKAIQVAREGKDRLSGLTDAQRGMVTGVTNGEAQLAAASASARMDASKRMFASAVSEAYRRIIQLCEARSDMVFPFAYRDNETGEMIRSVFYGGPGGGMDDSDNGYPFKPAYSCTIEPYSMEYVNRANRRGELQQAQAQFLTIAQAMKADPAIKGKKMIDDLFDTLDMPKSGDRYYDFQAAAAMLQQGYAMERQQAMAEAAGAVAGGKAGY